MELFLVAIILNPTAKEKHDDGAIPTVVVEGKTVLAIDANQAAMKAMQLVPAAFADKIDRLEVRTIPFDKPSARKY